MLGPLPPPPFVNSLPPPPLSGFAMREPAPLKLKAEGLVEGLVLREEEPILAASRRSFTAVSWASNLGEGVD